ncbi:hypothetical protein RSOL_035330, partial [Rhizoctonia solani AG-3 Rhs1AP]
MVEPVLKPIDTDLPETVNVTLDQWNDLFDRLAAMDATLRERDLFALTGHFRDPDGPPAGPVLRANYDSSSCHIVEGMSMEQECDIDSTIALMFAHIPIRDEAKLDYFMLPDVRYTLNSSYHVPGIEVDDGRERREIPIHKIPNARFAQVGDKLIRIHFPGLCQDEQLARQKNTNYVPEARMRELYNLGMLPALRDVLPPQLLRVMPASFDAEKFRAQQGSDNDRDRPPTYQQSPKPIPGQYVQRVCERLRDIIRMEPVLDWADRFVFVLEGRGLKSDPRSRHPPPEEVIENPDPVDPQDARGQAIDYVLREFHVPQLKQEPGRLYCDIGTTIWGYGPPDERGVSKAISLFPNVKFHAQMFNHLTGKPINECERWVQSSNGPYSKDEDALLGDLGGGRLDVKTPSELGVEEAQIYGTSKYLIYNLALSKKAKRTSPFKCQKNWRKELAEHFTPLAESFRQAPDTHSVAVRFESRLPYSSYGRVHHLIPIPFLCRWLLWLYDHVYWGNKSRRVLAITNSLDRFFTSPQRLSIRSSQVREYGSFVIILIWMVNALVNRPDDGGHWDEVHDSASVHAMVDGQVVPVRDLTMFYLHSLRLDGLPRISSQRTISTKTISYLFSTNKSISLTQLVAKLQGEHDILNNASAPPEVERITEDVWRTEDDDELLPSTGGFVIAPRRGNRQQVVAIDLQEDAPNMFENVFPQEEPMRYPSEELDPEERDVGPTLDQRLSNLLYKYPPQIIAKASNRRSKREAWCSLDASDASHETFRDASLPSRIFSSWVDCGYTHERWNTTVRAYFPTTAQHKETREKVLSGNAQGLHCLEAWLEWRTLLNEHDVATRKKIIKEAREWANREWRWLPWYTSNHLWRSGQVGKKHPSKTPKGDGLGGPWIIFNPKFRKSSQR